MILILIQCSDALLQSKQTFINLSPINTRLLFYLISMISCSFTACKVNKRDLAVQFALSLYADLQNCM